MKAAQRRRVAVAQRAAQPGTCRRCGGAVLVGDDADTVAVRVTVDAEPITRLVEAVAVLRGLATYDAAQGGAGVELWHRYPHHLESPHTRYPIHPEHRCGGRAAW